MRTEEIFVVTEEWFNEDENPSCESQVANVFFNLKEAEECMDNLADDFEEEMVDGDDWEIFKGGKMRGFYEEDDTYWYEIKITCIKKTYDDAGNLIDTEVNRVPN